MNRVLLYTMALMLAVTAAASEAIEAYRKEVKPFLSEKQLDAYGSMRYHLIQRYDSMIRGTFYDNVPELRVLAKQELERIAANETERLRAVSTKKAEFIPVPVLKKGEHPQIAGTDLVQNVVWPDGTMERRPVYLFGFGAFGEMLNDVDFLGKLGVNYAQTEIGPSHIYPNEGKYSSRRVDVLQKFLAGAEKNGILLDLLISPHYIPKWFFEKNPNANIHLGGFLRIGLNRPATAELMHSSYSRALPELADQAALYSVSVTNEPVAFLWHKDRDTASLWEQYLQKHYQTIGNLNRKWGTKYSEFSAIQPVLSPPQVPFEFDPRLYDWTDFNAERLANWIGGLGTIVAKSLPGKPQSSKMIQRNFKQYDLMQGVDVHHFCRNGVLNGFDGGTQPNESSFVRQMVARSLLTGARKAPLLNTEHHLLRDRNTDPVPEGFVRAAFFTDALTGLNGSVAWNWDWDGKDRNSIFTGLFRYRPGATEEYVRTGLDLMRLAPDVSAISRIEPEVGILYSRANILWNQESIDILHNTFAAVSAAGIQPVVIPDQLLASGKIMERFPKLKALILPDVRYLPDEVFSGLEVFMQSGFHQGRGVLLIGERPEMTPYWKKRSTGIFDDTAAISERLSLDKANSEAILKQLEKFGVKPEVTLRSSDGKIASGIFFRSTTVAGRRIGAAVNVGRVAGEFYWQDSNGKRLRFSDTTNLTPDSPQETFKLTPWEVRLGELK